MKKLLLGFTILSLIVVAGCDKKISNVDHQIGAGLIMCTDSEKEALACNLDLNPVCGDNNKTYDNYCIACASKEIDGYVLGRCLSPADDTCDDSEGVCKIPEIVENTGADEASLQEENTRTVTRDNGTQQLGIELMVIDPDA